MRSSFGGNWTAHPPCTSLKKHQVGTHKGISWRCAASPSYQWLISGASGVSSGTNTISTHSCNQWSHTSLFVWPWLAPLFYRLQRTYLGRDATGANVQADHQPASWNQVNSVLSHHPRSNNGVEGLNAAISRHFRQKRPSITLWFQRAQVSVPYIVWPSPPEFPARIQPACRAGAGDSTERHSRHGCQVSRKQPAHTARGLCLCYSPNAIRCWHRRDAFPVSEVPAVPHC